MDNKPVPPPNIGLLKLVNKGNHIFAKEYGNSYIAEYTSNQLPSTALGNVSNDSVHWTPKFGEENSLDLINKEQIYNCVFYPVFDEYTGIFSMAWLETNKTGRLDLKYSSIKSNKPGLVNLTNMINEKPLEKSNLVMNQDIYIQPNVDINNVIITDISGNTFSLDTFNINPIKLLGYEVTLPKKIKSVKFTQLFKLDSNIACLIGTAPVGSTATTDFIPCLPLSDIEINIYNGKTSNLKNSFVTDISGQFTASLKKGLYTFEIIIDNPSINFSQKIL